MAMTRKWPSMHSYVGLAHHLYSTLKDSSMSRHERNSILWDRLISLISSHRIQNAIQWHSPHVCASRDRSFTLAASLEEQTPGWSHPTTTPSPFSKIHVLSKISRRFHSYRMEGECRRIAYYNDSSHFAVIC